MMLFLIFINLKQSIMNYVDILSIFCRNVSSDNIALALPTHPPPYPTKLIYIHTPHIYIIYNTIYSVVNIFPCIGPYTQYVLCLLCVIYYIIPCYISAVKSLFVLVCIRVAAECSVNTNQT